jgi:hypothetical protein
MTAAYILGSHALGHHVRLTSEPVIASDLAKAACAAVQNVGRAGLREEKEEEDEAKSGQPHDLPDRPCPTICFDSKSSDERTEDGPANST